MNASASETGRGAVLLETGHLRVKRGRHGVIAYPVHDAFVGRSIDLYGEWSPGDAEVVSPYLRPGMTALDIGANIGTFTLFLAGAVGAGGHVHAFEPVRASQRLLDGNLALNGLAQVETHAVAVGAAAGIVHVPDLDHGTVGNFGAASLDPAGTGRPVPMITIDSLDLPACDLIKADVEGHERAVLAGAGRTLARFRPVLLLENEEPSLSPALVEALLALDYRLWWHSPPLFAETNWFGCRDDAFPGLGSLNVLGLPAERPDRPTGLRPVAGPDDWPAWWPDWGAQDPRS